MNKNVLIITQYNPREISGTIVTIENIFKSIPEYHIMHLSLVFHDAEENNDDSILFLDQEESRLNYAVWKRRWGKNKNTKKSVSEDLKKSSAIRKHIKEFSVGILDCERIRLKKDKLDRIRSFDPGFIYTVGGNIRILRLTHKIAKMLKKPVIIHFMDNWVETAYSTSFLFPFRLILNTCCRNVIRHTCVNFGISEPLSAMLSKKYHKEFLALMNPICDIKDPADIVEEQKKNLIFIYGGALTLNRWKGLYDIAKTIKENNPNNVFEIYAPGDQITDEIQTLFHGIETVIMPYLPYREIIEKYDQADVLVLSCPSGKINSRFAGYSLSTKIPEYMSRGKPILAYTEDEQYVLQYIEKNNAGIVIRDKNKLNDAINKLYDSKTRQMLARNGLECALSNHSFHSARKKFMYAIHMLEVENG